MIKSRLQPLYVFILLIPFLVTLPIVLSSYKRAVRDTVKYEPNGDTTVCIADEICSTYSKEAIEVISNGSGMNALLGNEYESKVALAKVAQKRYLSYFALNLIFLLAFGLPVLFFVLYNKITLEGNKFFLRTLIPSSIDVRPILTIYSWKVNYTGEINVENVKSINVLTKTPFIKNRKSLDEINWRDEVILKYVGENNTLKKVKFSLFLFTNLKKMFKKIVELNPSVEVLFDKTTAVANLKEIKIPPFN
jgi:hypothetical protein